MSSLKFDSTYWEQHLPSTVQNSDLETKLHLILSLVIFLSISIRHLLQFIFSSDIRDVKNKASRFLGYTPTATDDNQRFPPATIFGLWHSRWPQARKLLHDMIEPCVHEIVLEESNRVIKDESLQIRIKSLTIKGIRELLQPDALVEKFRKSAPLMFGLMHTFSASPNRYRKQKTAQKSRTAVDAGSEGEDWDDDPNAEENMLGDEGKSGKDWWKDYDGFSRNPVFVCLLDLLTSSKVLICT
jgi:hypothetical protein